MLYLTCTMISSVDLAHYVISHAKDWLSVDCGTSLCMPTFHSCLFKLLVSKIVIQSSPCYKSYHVAKDNFHLSDRLPSDIVPYYLISNKYVVYIE